MALRVAAEDGDLSLVRLCLVQELLRKGANPNDPRDLDEYGEAALSTSTGSDYPGIVEALVATGAELEHRDCDGCTYARPCMWQLLRTEQSRATEFGLVSRVCATIVVTYTLYL